MATLYHVNGKTDEVHPQNGDSFTLVEIQAYVEGYATRITLYDGRWMYINEKAHPIGLPFNRQATRLSERGRGTPLTILGPALVLTKEESKREVRLL